MLLKVAIIVLIAATIGSCFRIQIDETNGIEHGENPETLAGLFEGDIMLQPDEIAGKTGRNGMLNLNSRWLKNSQGYVEVPVRFEPLAFNSTEQTFIMNSIQELQQASCIRFVYQSTQRDYIRFTNEPAGCFSYMGRIGGVQQLNLASTRHGASTCLVKGIIQHEMLHALGFYHMQSSTDRDTYVQINFQNILPNYVSQFQVSNSTRFGTPYELQSVMHYGAKFFSSNGLPTIVPRNQSIPLDVMGQRVGATEGDKQRLRNMYQC